MEHDMEQREDDTEQRIREIEAQQDQLKSQLHERDGKVKELESSKQELQKRLDQTLADLHSESAARKAAEAKAKEGAQVLEEKEEAVARVDQLTRQAAAQADSYGVLEKELESLQSKLRDAVRAAGDAKDETEAKSRELASVNRRASTLEGQAADLEKELDERTKALAAYRGEKSQELMEALGKLATMEKKAGDQEIKLGDATRATDGLRQRLERTEAHLKEVEERSSVDKTALEKQISLQETLTRLQKDKADEAMKKITALQGEIRGLQSRVAKGRDEVSRERKRADTFRDESKAVVEKLKVQLAEKEKEVTKAAAAAAASAQSQGAGGGDPMEAEPVPLDLSVDLNTLDDTELKMRLMQMERELEFVRSERDRNQMYLSRIMREVDQKSPLLMSNKKDYQRVLQSHEQLFLKVEASMRRCQKAEMEREVAAKGRDRIEQELEVTKNSLADLGAQVQNLLKDKLERDLGRPLERNGGGGVSKQAANGGGNIVPQDLDQVISDHLVTFQDIRELQERNRSLVQVVRQMTAELKDAKASKVVEQDSIDNRVVKELERQLDELKESRKRQDEMLVAITQSRDMYRVLLAQETNKDPSSSNGVGGGSSSSPAANAAAAQELEAMKSRVHELERDLGVARDESRKLQESLRLMGDEVITAERAQSKAKAEYASTQRLLSHAEAQIEDLTADRSSRTKALDQASDKFMSLTDNVVRLQTHLEQQKNDALDAQNKAKDLALTNQALRADKNIAEASEARLRAENESLRNEAREKKTLIDKLVDTDFVAKAGQKAELSALQEELSSVRRKAESDRNDRAAAELAQAHTASKAREKVRELENDLASLKAECDKAKSAATAAAASEKVAATKAIELSARLNEARAHLATGGGGGGGAGAGGASRAGAEDGMAGQLAEVGKLQMELQSLKAELKAKTEALATNERQRRQYEAMAKSKQQQLDQLLSSSKSAKESLEGKVKEALAKAQAAEGEARSAKTGLASTVNELVKEKEAAEAESLERKKEVDKLRDDLHTAKSSAANQDRRMDGISKELEVQRTAARAAEERYRQELEAHAGAITALRQAEDAQDECNKAARDAKHAKDRLAADLMGARAQWDAREAILKKTCQDTEERLSSLNSQHEILTKHLQNLTEQMEAAQAKREKEDKAIADRVAGEGDASATGAGSEERGDADSEEREEKMRLARAVKELTELVRHKGRDVQVLTTDLELSKQRVTKLEAELDRTKQSLREAREEVQRAASETVGAVSKTEHRKLLAEVAQISTLRESNDMLRSKLGEAERRQRSTEQSLNQLRAQMAPLQRAQREQSASSASLASEKESLRKEVENWKKRVSSLTASFNAVDPKEHEEVIAAKEGLEKALAEANQAKGSLESSKAELAQSKADVEKQRDHANITKTKLIAQVLELRKTLGAAGAQKTAITRDLESKLAAEKDKATKAANEASSLRQEVARTRANANNTTASATKQLTDQVAKAKAEGETLRAQLRQALSAKDGSGQLDTLRKRVVELEQDILAKDRENMTNRSMYDNMKGVSRKIKENLATAQQAVRERNDQITKLQARVTELQGQSSPTTGTNTTAPAPAAAAAAAAPAGGAAARQSRPLSPVPPSQQQRGLSPSASTMASRAAASAANTAGAAPAPAAATSAAAGGGDDGGEASLRSRLMARSKRPLAPASETSGPSKRAHKPTDDPATTSASTAATASGSGSGSGMPTTGGFGAAPAAAVTAGGAAASGKPPMFGSGFGASKAPASSTPSTESNSFSTSTSKTTPAGGSTASGFGAAAPAPAAAPSTLPGAGSSADAPAPAPAPASAGFGAGGTGGGGGGGGGSIFGSSSTSLSATARPFGFSGAGWGGGPSSSAPAPAPAPSTSAAGSTPAKFGGMTWGAPRAADTGAAPSSTTTTTASSSTTSASSSFTTSTPAAAASSTAPASAAPASTPAAATTTVSGGSGGVDAAAGGKKGGAAGGGGMFGGGAGFAGFGSGGGFGNSKLANMTPPSSGATNPTFGSVNLPVPATSATPPTAPPTTTAFGTAPLGTITSQPSGSSSKQQQPQQQQQQQQRSVFGSSSAGSGSGGGQMKFGLSPATTGAATPSFGSALATFGRPVAHDTSATTTTTTTPTTTAAAAPSPAAAAASAPAASPASASVGLTSSAGGDSAGAGGDQAGDGGAAAAAAAGVPGPAALRLDVEARRAARERRFATQAPGSVATSAASTEKVAAAASAPTDADAGGAGTAAHEEGEVDDDDDGDGF
ncbi:unnamed protein product [Scytosiphon promiscuus]